jgi:hypothetical protein
MIILKLYPSAVPAVSHAYRKKIIIANKKCKLDFVWQSKWQFFVKKKGVSFCCRSFQPRQPRFGVFQFRPIRIGVLPNVEKMLVTRHRLGGQAFLLVQFGQAVVETGGNEAQVFAGLIACREPLVSYTRLGLKLQSLRGAFCRSNLLIFKGLLR